MTSEQSLSPCVHHRLALLCVQGSAALSHVISGGLYVRQRGPGSQLHPASALHPSDWVVQLVFWDPAWTLLPPLVCLPAAL